MDTNEIDEGMTLPELEDVIFSAFEQMDPTSAEFGDAVEGLARLYGAGITKQQIIKEAEIAREKIRTEAEVNYDKNTVDEYHYQEEERANKARENLKAKEIASTIAIAIGSGIVNWVIFKRATAREAESSFLTVTERTVATEGLKRGLFRGFSGLFGRKEL